MSNVMRILKIISCISTLFIFASAPAFAEQTFASSTKLPLDFQKKSVNTEIKPKVLLSQSKTNAKNGKKAHQRYNHSLLLNETLPYLASTSNSGE